MTSDEKKALQLTAVSVREGILTSTHGAKAGHPGGSLSAADMFTYLYFKEMRIDPKNPRWEGRDWCVMSKGHAGPAMYATLGLKGFYPVTDAYTLNQPHTNFPSHTDRTKTPGIDLTTGSLGQGMSSAVGAALGNKMDGRDNHTFVFVGDGEADEGQIWEGAQFAAHYKLSNLICFVDSNKRQLDGKVDDIMGHGKGLGAKFDAFGWNVIDVADGNDVEQVWNAVQEAYKADAAPTCIILLTEP